MPDPYWPDPYLGELDYGVELPKENEHELVFQNNEMARARAQFSRD